MTDFTKLKESLPPDPLIADGAEVRISTAVGSFWLATCSTETVARAIAAIPEMLAEIERLSRVATADAIIARLRTENADLRAENAGLRKLRETMRKNHMEENEFVRAENAKMRAKTIGEALDAVYWFHNVSRYTLADVASRIRAILGETEGT